MTTATAQPTDFGLPITAAQRKALFAAGRAHGLDVDGLRELTPAGSISRLTRLQANQLIDRLNAGTEHSHPKRHSRLPRRPKGIYAVRSGPQMLKIEALRIDLGWTPEGLQGWLAERHHADGRAMTRINSTADAAAVIELLKAVLVKTDRARARGTDAEPLAEGQGRPSEPD
jgi:hypothetical protein